nr:unnamed protein product [Digitaria exilis]
MALFRKFFYRKPPDGLLEITERVYVFDSCFTTDVFDNEKYRDYISDIVTQLRSHFADASFMTIRGMSTAYNRNDSSLLKVCFLSVTQADCELIKIDIHCHIQGDVVLECISLDADQEREEMMFRVMFNTAFIRSNILMLNRDEIDMLWDAKERFPKEFRAEVIFSEMDTANQLDPVEVAGIGEKEGLPVEAFAKVQEMFSNVDWLDPTGDAAIQLFQRLTSSENIQLRQGFLSPSTHVVTTGMPPPPPPPSPPALLVSNDILRSEAKDSSQHDLKNSGLPSHTERKSTLKPLGTSTLPTHHKKSSTSVAELLPTSPAPPPPPPSPPPLCLSSSIYHVHPDPVLAPTSFRPAPAPPSPPASPMLSPVRSHAPLPPPLLPPAASISSPLKLIGTPPFTPPPPSLKSSPSTSRPPAPPPPPQLASTSSIVRPAPPPLPLFASNSSPLRHAAPPPPPAPTSSPIGAAAPPPPPPPGTNSGPPPPPPPCYSSKQSSNPMDKSMPSPPVPPPPSHGGRNGASGNIVPPPAPPGGNAKLFGSQGRGPAPPSGPMLKSFHSGQAVSRRSNLKPLHWVKVTRAMHGSLWAESQKPDETLKAPVFDMSELETLFSAVLPSSDSRRSDKSGSRASGSKTEKIHLIDLRRANNCGIMLTKVKMPLPDLMSAILALDDTVLDADQVDNLIKFTPTKEEIELLKGYKGDKQVLGECEQFFMELMKVPRVESKLRVFSFKIQFRSQVSDLKRNLNIVNSSAEEIRGSVKLKRIMQTILSLGNALNQGTARGSAVGFRLDSLLKLSDTRARNNKMTLMHYLSKVLSDKLPELLDFPKDLASLELAAKIQLKSLAEEMQAVNKGLEKVEQELTTSENDGPVSEIFRKVITTATGKPLTFCQTLKDFLNGAEAKVRSLTSLYSNVGRNADALALYFGEDPARCPFEQVVTTLQNFVRLFTRSHEENCKQLDLEKKKALKEAEENSKQLDLEKKKAQKEAEENSNQIGLEKGKGQMESETEKTKIKSDNDKACEKASENDKGTKKEMANEKAKLNNSIKELDISLQSPAQTASAK